MATERDRALMAAFASLLDKLSDFDTGYLLGIAQTRANIGEQNDSGNDIACIISARCSTAK